MASVLENLVEPKPALKVVQAKLFRRGMTASDRGGRRALPCVVQVVRERKGA